MRIRAISVFLFALNVAAMGLLFSMFGGNVTLWGEHPMFWKVAGYGAITSIIAWFGGRDALARRRPGRERPIERGSALVRAGKRHARSVRPERNVSHAPVPQRKPKSEDYANANPAADEVDDCVGINLDACHV